MHAQSWDGSPAQRAKWTSTQIDGLQLCLLPVSWMWFVSIASEYILGFVQDSDTFVFVWESLHNPNCKQVAMTSFEQVSNLLATMWSLDINSFERILLRVHSFDPCHRLQTLRKCLLCKRVGYNKSTPSEQRSTERVPGPAVVTCVLYNCKGGDSSQASGSGQEGKSSLRILFRQAWLHVVLLCASECSSLRSENMSIGRQHRNDLNQHLLIC